MQIDWLNLEETPPAPGFEYSIKRGRRKTLGIYVKDSTVEVRIPYFTRHEDVHPWVLEKADWIRDQLKKQQIEAAEKPDIRHGGSILFLGQEKKLHHSGRNSPVHEDEHGIHISSSSMNMMQRNLEKWLRLEAECYLNERLGEWATLMKETSRIRKVQYRKTRSKWGHCTADGILQFNWLIIMAPPEVIDYLIIHEISHLTHMNHSVLFWQHVSRFCPDYKTHRNWLKKNGHRIWL